MKKKNLWLTVGAPGSGKSTYVKEHFDNGSESNAIISRDEIRFNMLGEKDEYFCNETKVYNTFVHNIQKCLNDDRVTNIIADATHLNEGARNKLLDRLKLDNVNINILFFDTSLETCLERNSHRSGRAYVPESAIRNMKKSLRKPSNNEKYKYNLITIIKEDAS